MIGIDTERVLDTMRKVVAERGEGYVYDERTPEGECVYVLAPGSGEPARPSCLVAHVLHRLGVSLEVLAGREGDSPSDGRFMIAAGLDLDAANVLQAAQDVQDRRFGGNTWGDALRAAEREHFRTLAGPNPRPPPVGREPGQGHVRRAALPAPSVV